MSLINYIKNIFTTPLSDLTGINFVVMLSISIACIAALICISIFIFKFFRLLFRGIRNILSAKSKCQHIQCNVCGRTLDRCVCAKNKGRGNASRLHQHTLEERSRKKKHR